MTIKDLAARVEALEKKYFDLLVAVVITQRWAQRAQKAGEDAERKASEAQAQIISDSLPFNRM